MNVRRLVALVSVALPLMLPITVLTSLFVAGSAWAQTYTELYSFSGGADGSYPVGGLIQDSAGNLYGTTSYGTNHAGAVFKLTPSGKLKVLHTFDATTDGARPYAGLVRGNDGNLYGTALEGGTFNRGTVFKLDKHGRFSVLHTFTGGADGGYPSAPLIFGAGGNLYGTTTWGGDNTNCADGCGVIFKMDTSGNETILHTFLNFEDGLQPTAGLTVDAKGNLYGTTEIGGNYCGDDDFFGCGVVFKLTPGGDEHVLHVFDFTSGDSPEAALVRDTSGNLYGTAALGGYGGMSAYGEFPGACGFGGCGVLFQLDKKGREKVLYRFTGGFDGDWPLNLTMDASGNLYGTTLQGGGCGAGYACGTLFKLDLSGHLEVLLAFVEHGAAGPHGGVLISSDGNLFGTTYFGGTGNCSGGCGVIYKITP